MVVFFIILEKLGFLSGSYKKQAKNNHVFLSISVSYLVLF